MTEIKFVLRSQVLFWSLDCFAQNNLMWPRFLMGQGGLSRAWSLLLTAITDNQDMIGFVHHHLHTSPFTIINIKPNIWLPVVKAGV